MDEKYQDVNEINLIDLMFYCLKRWRWIVIYMVFLAIIAGIYKYEATITNNQIKKKQQAQQMEIESAVEETEVEGEPIIFEDPVTSAVAFVIIGLVGGACLTCLIFCMSYIMSGKLKDENNFQQKFGMPLLGIIRRKETKKKLFGFVDRWIWRLEEGPCASIPRTEQIKIAAVNLQNVVHRDSEKKIKKVMLAGTVASNDVLEICGQLTEEIENITFSPYRQIVLHASALKKLEDYDGIVFIEKENKSYEKLIKKEKEIALDRSVIIIGAIVCQ